MNSHQAAHVVALRESLAMHESARLERGLRQQKAVGGDRDRPADGSASATAAPEAVERRCSSHGDAACDTDHERDVRALGTEERRRRVCKVLRRADVEVEQARQRQVDVRDFVERHRLVEADERPQLRLGEWQRRRSPQPRPLGAAELDESRDSDILTAAGHAAILWHQAMCSRCSESGAVSRGCSRTLPSSGGDRNQRQRPSCHKDITVVSFLIPRKFGHPRWPDVCPNRLALCASGFRRARPSGVRDRAGRPDQQGSPAPIQKPRKSPDFLFGRPDGSIGIRGNWVFSRAGSDWYDFVTKQLTVERGDFNGPEFAFGRLHRQAASGHYGGRRRVECLDQLRVPRFRGQQPSSDRAED